MCLYAPQGIDRKKGIGWKVLIERSGRFIGPIFHKRYQKDVWYRARGKASDPDCGFHVFLKRKHAMDYARGWFMPVLVRVEYKNARWIGCTVRRRDTITAREMKVVSALKGLGPKGRKRKWVRV